MKKSFKSYTAVWVISLLLFNIIAFVSPIEKDGGFFAGYIFITLSFIGQLACAKIAFKAENLQKLFYNIPIIHISFIGIVVMLFIGMITMIIPGFPIWLGIILCAIVLGFTAISVIGASNTAEVVDNIDVKIKEKTFIMRTLGADAHSLISMAKEHQKEYVKKVWEALRYSDPVSCDALSGLESEITIRFSRFKTAVLEDLPDVSFLADDIVILIAERNNKCKLLK